MVINLHSVADSVILQVQTMLLPKLLEGVVVLEREGSRRAVRPRFLHRIMLVWVFRHFSSLPLVVLSRWQRMLLAVIVAQGIIVPVPGRDSGTIIGTVESGISPAAEEEPLATEGGWDYARRGPAGNRASA